MPAAETKSNPIADSVATATGRINEFNERAAANGRKAGAAYLDSYEKGVLSLVDSYEKTAEATKLDWVTTLASAQADFTREVTKAYTGAAREFVS
jgi:hypothetical protein